MEKAAKLLVLELRRKNDRLISNIKCLKRK